MNGLAQGDEFFNAIVDERALEFVGEFLRKGDLIRWNLLDSKLQAAEAELTAFAADNNYLGRYLWYRYGTDSHGVTTIEMYGLGRDESDALSSETPPPGSGWMVHTNSEGEPTQYFPGDGSMLDDKKGILLYVHDNVRDGHVCQWWPIFETTITSSQNTLKNDYGF